MNEMTNDELVSAYLDGELTGEDLARAQRLLAEQPDSRQLLDELRALGASVRALSEHKLEADFSQRVLRRAERLILSGESSDGTADGESSQPIEPASIRGAAAGEKPPGRSPWRRPLIIWTGVAVAATLLVMVVHPGGPVMGPVSMVTEDARLAGEAPPANETSPRESAATPPTGTPGGMADTQRDLARRSNGSGRTLEKNNVQLQAHSMRNRPAGNVDEQAKSLSPPEDRSYGKAGLETVQGQTAPTMPQRPATDSRSEQDADFGNARKAAAPPSAPPAADQLMREGQLAQDGQLVHEGLIVCQVQISPAAADGKAFDASLSRQQVVWDNPADSDLRDRAATKSDHAPTTSPVEKKRQNKSENWQAEILDAVYVVATEEQLQAMLADMQAQQDLFLKVALVSTPGFATGQVSGARVQPESPVTRQSHGGQRGNTDFGRFAQDKSSAGGALQVEVDGVAGRGEGATNSPVAQQPQPTGLGGGQAGAASSRAALQSRAQRLSLLADGGFGLGEVVPRVGEPALAKSAAALGSSTSASSAAAAGSPATAPGSSQPKPGQAAVPEPQRATVAADTPEFQRGPLGDGGVAMQPGFGSQATPSYRRVLFLFRVVQPAVPTAADSAPAAARESSPDR